MAPGAPQLACPQCGTVYDVSRYPTGHRFPCHCGRELEVGASGPVSQGGPAAGSVPPARGSDPGLQPLVKVLVFFGNLCFSPLAALVSLIVWFVIKGERPRTAKDLCTMTWIPVVLLILLVLLAIIYGALAGEY